MLYINSELVWNTVDAGEQNTDNYNNSEVSEKNLRKSSDSSTAKQPSSRKTSFREPEAETISISLTSHREEEEEEEEN